MYKTGYIKKDFFFIIGFLIEFTNKLDIQFIDIKVIIIKTKF
jgi:hypothetical protein